MIRLLLNSDEEGVVEFSDRGISRETEIPYQQVRTIHQRWIDDGTITNAPSNASSNAKRCFVTICDYDSYNIINIFLNAVTNAVVNALKEQEGIKKTDKDFPHTPLQTDKINNQEQENTTPYNPPTGDDSEVLAKLAEMEKAFAELSEENRKLKEDNDALKKKKAKKEKQDDFDVRSDLSYVDCYADLWNEWLDYKDEIKKQYKTQRGAKSAFTEFKNLSKGDYGKARAIIEQSFRKSWDGLFDVKDYVPNMFEQPTQVSQLIESVPQKFYAFNVAFDTEKEADDFYDEQVRIRDGIYNGTYRVADNHVDDWIAQGNAVKVVDGVVYHYDV